MTNTLIALLGIVAAAVAVPVHFPHGKTIMYKYNADVKAGAMQPANFASQFGFECLLNVTHNPDQTLKNAYHVAMSDVKHGLYNGPMEHFQHHKNTLPISDAAKDILNPFMMVYDETGHLRGIQVMKNESTWSMNIKKAIASALQLDLANIHIHSPMKPHSFINHENTIHGKCQVAYNVHPKVTEDSNKNVFTVTKIHDPSNCSNYMYYLHNIVEHERCHIPAEADTTTASRRVFEIEDQGNAVLIKQLIAHGVINYIPLQAKSEAHYILTNQTFTLMDVVPQEGVRSSMVNFQELPIIYDFTYIPPNKTYLPDTAIDVTNGRHVVNLDQIVMSVKNMLGEAADYLKENQIRQKPADGKHGQTINRIISAMAFMDAHSFEQLFSELQDTGDNRQKTMRNVFLGIVPNVGTPASMLFVRNIVLRKMIPDQKILLLLSVLPMHAKQLSQDLLLKMEPLLQLSHPSKEVKKAGILCFATLIRKTFLHPQNMGDDQFLDKWLDYFMEHIKNEPTLEMKTVYTMCMKNVGLKDIVKHLEPIIKGELVIDKDHQIRQHAIEAVKRVVGQLPNNAHDLLWPVLSDVKLPVQLRITAYDALMHQYHYPARYMNMYWFMVHEKNEHLYNYHVSTLQGIANAVDPCLMPVREMARKLLKFTRIRYVPGPLSVKHHFDYIDDKFGYGEAWKSSWILNPHSGLPESGSINHFRFVARKPANRWGLHWHIKGLDQIIKHLKKEMFGWVMPIINNENMKSMLFRASTDTPSDEEVDIHLILTLNNNVVTTFHADKNEWKEMLNKWKDWRSLVNKHLDNFDWEHVIYYEQFERHLPNDFGLPSILTIKLPSFNSLKIHASAPEQSNAMTLKWQMKYIDWSHGVHTTTLYNPIADVWHSIHKTMALDVAMPIDASISYFPDTKSVKVTLPRLPSTEFSVAGMVTSSKSIVTVTGDETNALGRSCPECHQYEVVTNNVDKKMYKNAIDSKETGLRYSIVIYNCENNHTPVLPWSEWLVLFSNRDKSTMNNMMVQMIMSVRQQLMNNLILSQDAGCSNLIKAEPSIIYPTSFVDLTGKMSIQDYDTDKMHVLNSKRIDVRGTMTARMVGTNDPVRQWDANLNVVMNQGHVNNTVKVMITRSGREEKNLKICIDGQKNYPVIESDILKIDGFDEETNGKMKITMGETNEDKCVHDDLDLTVVVKGKLSEEQRKMMQNQMNGTCMEQINDPLLNPDGKYVPKTWQCVHEAILDTSLRRYTIDVTSRKSHLPALLHAFQDMFSAVSWRQLDPRSLSFALEYPVLQDSLNLYLLTPTSEHHLVQLPWGHPVWNMWMDSTRFSTPALYKYLNSYTKMCTIYPKVLLTFDNGTIPFVAPNKWTLMVGDQKDKSFSVATRAASDTNMDMKIFVGQHGIEIINVDGGVMVTVDGSVVPNYEKGVMVPPDQPESYVLKLTHNYKHLIVQSHQVPVLVAHTPSSVTVFLDSHLQGRVTGMCGHMDGSHHSVLPKLHTASHL